LLARPQILVLHKNLRHVRSSEIIGFQTVWLYSPSHQSRNLRITPEKY
jgi:hypothetical protein